MFLTAFLSSWVSFFCNKAQFDDFLFVGSSEEDPFGAAPFDTEKIRRQLSREKKKAQTVAQPLTRTGNYVPNRKSSSDDLIRF